MLRLAAHGIMSFSEKPLLWSLWLGLMWLFAGGLLLLVALILAIAGKYAGSFLLYGVIGLATGSVLSAVGILGGYLARVYDEVKGGPCMWWPGPGDTRRTTALSERPVLLTSRGLRKSYDTCEEALNGDLDVFEASF